MKHNLCVVSLENSLEEVEYNLDMLRTLIQLTQAVAYFMSEQVAAVLQIESLDEAFNCLYSANCPQTEERIDAVGDGFGDVLQGRSVLWRLVMIDDHHFLAMLLLLYFLLL